MRAIEQSKIDEIIRLSVEEGLGRNAISERTGISSPTVTFYLRKHREKSDAIMHDSAAVSFRVATTTEITPQEEEPTEGSCKPSGLQPVDEEPSDEYSNPPFPDVMTSSISPQGPHPIEPKIDSCQHQPPLPIPLTAVPVQVQATKATDTAAVAVPGM